VLVAQRQDGRPQRRRGGGAVPAAGGVVGAEGVVAPLPPAGDQLADGAGWQAELAGDGSRGGAGPVGAEDGLADVEGQGARHDGLPSRTAV
jgi:hypothetical protein